MMRPNSTVEFRIFWIFCNFRIFLDIIGLFTFVSFWTRHRLSCRPQARWSSRSWCGRNLLRYHVCRKTCLLSRFSAPSLCVTSPCGALIGPPTAFRRNGPHVPWVSLPGPTGVTTHPRWWATKAPTTLCGCVVYVVMVVIVVMIVMWTSFIHAFFDTCLIGGLLPLNIILITASLCSKTYNIALDYEIFAFVSTLSTWNKIRTVVRGWSFRLILGVLAWRGAMQQSPPEPMNLLFFIGLVWWLMEHFYDQIPQIQNWYSIHAVRVLPAYAGTFWIYTRKRFWVYTRVVVVNSAYQNLPTWCYHLIPEAHQRNPWILHDFSWRIDREHHVPDSSNHSLCLTKLFNSSSPGETLEGTNREMVRFVSRSHEKKYNERFAR